MDDHGAVLMVEYRRRTQAQGACAESSLADARAHVRVHRSRGASRNAGRAPRAGREACPAKAGREPRSPRVARSRRGLTPPGASNSGLLICGPSSAAAGADDAVDETATVLFRVRAREPNHSPFRFSTGRAGRCERAFEAQGAQPKTRPSPRPSRTILAGCKSDSHLALRAALGAEAWSRRSHPSKCHFRPAYGIRAS